MTTLSNPWPVHRDEGSTTPGATTSDALIEGKRPNDSRRGSLRRTQSFLRLLQHYDAPGTRPPSARTDPSIAQRDSIPFSLWNLGRIGYAAALKASEVATDILQHVVWGPRRKSWPLEMTIISSFMRNAGRHSHLVDIATMRILINLGGLVPLPADALVTPVTFRVRRRDLKGILIDFDSAESGRRELQGEWIVGKRLWRRLQAEWRSMHSIRTVPGDGFVYPQQPVKSAGKGRVILFLHGGAYYCFSAATHRLITIPLSKYADARIFAVDYRLAPETRFPGPLHDAVSAYLRLVDDLKVPPSNILVAGDSAGGGLALSLLMYLRDVGRPLPAGAILLSPWCDLSMSCNSWDTNAEYDVVPVPQPGDALNPVNCYLGEHMERYLTHPYASPLFGDFTGLPPMLIQAGEAEVLRDEITLLAHKAKAAGVQVRHEIYEDAVHVFQAFPFLEATTRAFECIRDFVRGLPQLDSMPTGLAREVDNDHTVIVDGDGTEGRKEDTAAFRNESVASNNPLPADDDVRSWRAEESPWPSPPASDEDDEDNMSTPKTGLLLPHTTSSSGAPIVSASPAPMKVQDYFRNTPDGPRPRNHVRRRTATLSIGSSDSAPRPLVRSSASHADISALCDQWAAEPTHPTTYYRHTPEILKPKARRESSFML